jgi:hypothetical protein
MLVLVSKNMWTQWAVPWVLALGLPTHTFSRLEGAYALGWLSALWRTFCILAFAFVALLIFLLAITLVGLAGRWAAATLTQPSHPLHIPLIATDYHSGQARQL